MKCFINQGQPADFWIARVGSRAGEPITAPYTSTNCIGVTSDDPAGDFARLMCAYLAGRYWFRIRGTCQQAIRVSDVKAVYEEVSAVPAGEAKAVVKKLRTQAVLKAQLDQLEKQIRRLAQRTLVNRVEVSK